MFLIALFVIGLAVVPATGARMGRLLDLRFRSLWLLQAAVVVQVLIIYVVPGAGHAGMQRGVHLAPYGMAAAFVWRNHRVAGMKLLGMGGAGNLAAITANHGIMPTLPGAARTAGFGSAVDGFQNSAVTAECPLWFLGDVFAIPAGVPLANVFSVGDVVLLTAALTMVFTVTGVAVPRLQMRTRRLAAACTRRLATT